jgi:hypothetical protein
MFRPIWASAALLAMLAAVATPAVAASPLTVDVLRAELRTANPDEEAFLTYVATLLEQNRLPREMVESVFQWARRKPALKRAEYFRQAMINRAAEFGITLPQGTPALRGTIQGRVYTRVLWARIPTPNVTVTIDGVNHSTVTDHKGEFVFKNVPLGTYTLHASGVTGFLSRAADTQVMLPSRPPSTEPAFVSLEAK